MRNVLAALLLLVAACGDVTDPPSRLGVGLVTIAQPSPVFMAGDTLQLSIVALKASGEAIANPPVFWVSSNPGGIQVLQNGRIIALAPGASATITAKVDNVVDSVQVRTCDYQYVSTGNHFRLMRLAGGIYDAATYDGTDLLFHGTIMYGSTPENFIVAASLNGTSQQVETPTPACHALLNGGDYTRTLTRPRPGVNQPILSPVTVVQETFAPNGANADDIVLFRYTFTNTSGTTLSGFRFGLGLDWDIVFDSDGFNDFARYNPELSAVEAYQATTLETAGIAAIDAPITYYEGIDYRPSAGQLPNIGDYFARMSSGVSTQTIGPIDVAHLAGFGPFVLLPGEKKSVMFVMTAARTREKFNANVAIARLAAAQFPNP